MAAKRQPDRSDPAGSSRPKKPRSNARPSTGFSVGPANLPDGTHRRKVQKIKKDLIHKAKVKKQYAKIREQALRDDHADHGHRDDDGGSAAATSPGPGPSLDPHPERQAMLDEPENDDDGAGQQDRRSRAKQRKKPQTFGKEAALGQKRKEEAEARRAAREAAEKERQEKIAHRERMRKQMAKARTPGADGKRRLGREAPVLLERVKKIVGNA